jgi:hypothetical protein
MVIKEAVERNSEEQGACPRGDAKTGNLSI